MEIPQQLEDEEKSLYTEVDEFQQKFSSILNELKVSSYSQLSISNKRLRIATRKSLKDEKTSVYETIDEEVIHKITPLLEKFQSGIDLITRQITDVENLYNTLRDNILNIPEFNGIKIHLMKCLDQHLQIRNNLEKSNQKFIDEMQLQRNEYSKAERENLRLNQSLEDLSKELSLLKNQSSNIRLLESQLREQKQRFKFDVEAAVSQRDEAWQQTLQELKETHEDAVKTLTDEVERERGDRHIAEEAAKNLEDSVLQVKLEHEKETGSKDYLIELLQQEVDRLSSMTATSVTAGDTVLDDRVVQASQELMEVHQKRIQLLEETIEEERRVYKATEMRWKQTVDELKSNLVESQNVEASSKLLINEMKFKLQSLPSKEEVEELKEKIRVIEIVNHCDVQNVSTDVARESLMRQQQLEGHCATLRSNMEQLQFENQNLSDNLSDTIKQLTDCKQLINDLEGQLNAQTEKHLITNGIQKMDINEGGSNAAMHALKMLDTSNEMNASSRDSTSELQVPNMLDIVISQRDRLRTRVLEVEQSRDDWKLSAENERQQVLKMQQDNVALVEKIRYLESWTSNSEASKGAVVYQRGVGRGVSTSDRTRISSLSESRGMGWNRYEEEYEAELSDQLVDIDLLDTGESKSTYLPVLYDMNNSRGVKGSWMSTLQHIVHDIRSAIAMTIRRGSVAWSTRLEGSGGGSFNKFRANEKLRKLHALNIPERVVIIWGTLLLSQRSTRLFAFFYLLVIHALVAALFLF